MVSRVSLAAMSLIEALAWITKVEWKTSYRQYPYRPSYRHLWQPDKRYRLIKRAIRKLHMGFTEVLNLSIITQSKVWSRVLYRPANTSDNHYQDVRLDDIMSPSRFLSRFFTNLTSRLLISTSLSDFITTFLFFSFSASLQPRVNGCLRCCF